MTKVSDRTECPACAAEGNDNSGDNLIEFEDGSKHCYACGYHDGGSSAPTHQVVYRLPPHTFMPENGMPAKGLTLKTLNKFGVVWRAEMRPDGTPETEHEGDFYSFVGSKEGVVGFPYFSWDGKLIGAKFRNFAQEKKTGKKSMWFEGDSKEITWFGINTLNEKANKLVLTEGESDTLTLSQVLSSEYNVLGVSGAGGVEKAIRGSFKQLRKYKEIYLCFDSDDAGVDAREKALTLLPPGCSRVVNLPAGVKDVNELLVNDRQDEIKRSVANARPVLPRGIVEDEDMIKRAMTYVFDKTVVRGDSTGFPTLDAATGGLVKGKMVTIAGGTGCGKSTIVENIVRYAAMEQGKKSFILSLEMSSQEVLTRLLQQHIQKEINDPFFDVSKLSPTRVEQHLRKLVERIKFFDHVGGTSVDELIDTMHYAVDYYGVDVIVLDNFTSASNSQDWKDIDNLSIRLKTEIALKRNVCVLAVSHISRNQGSDNQEKMPTLSDLRASNGVAMQSDVVLGVFRKGEGAESNIIECKTIKRDRKVGKSYTFKLEMKDCRLVEVGQPLVEYTAKHTEDEDKQVSRYSAEWVPVETGGEDTPVLPVDDVRTVPDTVVQLPPLHAGLRTEQRDSSRGEGEVTAGGRTEVESGEEVLERPRPQAFARDSIRGTLYANGFRWTGESWRKDASRDDALPTSRLVYSNAELAELGSHQAVQETTHN